MMYQSPAIALDEITAIYDSQRKQAEQYAARQDAKQSFTDYKFDELTRFHNALETLQVFAIGTVLAEIPQQVDNLQRADSELSEVVIIVRLRPGGNGVAHICHKLYADPAN